MKSFQRSPLPAAVAGRWLVLGASGFIGSAVLACLKAGGYEVLGCGRSRPGKVEPWHQIDVFETRNLCACLRSWQPAFIVNAIGSGTAMTGAEVRDFYGRSTTIMMKAVRTEVPACRVVLVGSAAEYGNSTEPGGSVETGSCRPLTDYGRAKVEQFQVAARFAAGGLRTVTARLFNPIGPGQGKHQLVGGLLERIRRGENPLRVHSGNHVRDWIDVRDAACGLVTLATAMNPPPVVNLCTGQGHPVSFVAAAVGKLAGVTVESIPGEVSPKVLWNSIGNPNQIFRLGWRPKYKLAESLSDQFRSHL